MTQELECLAMWRCLTSWTYRLMYKTCCSFGDILNHQAMYRVHFASEGKGSRDPTSVITRQDFMLQVDVSHVWKQRSSLWQVNETADIEITRSPPEILELVSQIIFYGIQFNKPCLFRGQNHSSRVHAEKFTSASHFAICAAGKIT